MALADPVSLLHLNAVYKIHIVQIFYKAVGIRGDLQHPLALLFSDDLGTAALAHAVYNFLVCKHAFAGGAPVYRHFLFVGKAALKELKEDPLGPLIVIGIRSIDLSCPVKRKAERLKLALEMGNIIFCYLRRMNVILDCVIFRWKPERIPAHGIKHIIALQPFLSCHDIQRRIRTRVAYMKPLTAGIGKFNQAIKFWK